MIDKTILELTDRVAAYAIRATKAEHEAEFLKNQLEAEAKLTKEATDLVKKLNEENESLCKKLEEQKESTSYWYKEANKFEEELKKHDET